MYEKWNKWLVDFNFLGAPGRQSASPSGFRGSLPKARRALGELRHPLNP